MSTPLSQARTQFPRLAEAAVERARLTVVPRRTQKAPRVPFVSLVSLLLVTGVVGLLLFNTRMQQSSFVATSMEERATVLAAKEQSLQMQLEQLRDPQRVATRAKRMGMVPASSPAFIRLSDGEIARQAAARRARRRDADQPAAHREAQVAAARPGDRRDRAAQGRPEGRPEERPCRAHEPRRRRAWQP